MPRIPDVNALGARPIPTPQGGQYRPPDMTAAGNQIAAAGRDLAQVGEQQQASLDKLNYAKAKADYLTQTLEVESQFENDTDYTTLPERYGTAQKQVADSILAAMPDRRLRDMLAIEFQGDMAQQSYRIKQRANTIWKDSELATGIQNVDNMTKAFERTGDPKYLQTASDTWSGLSSAGVIDQAAAATRRIETGDKMLKGRLGVMPVNFRQSIRDRFTNIDPATYTAAPAAIQLVVDKFEGGYSNDPDDRGGETIFGISSKHWPEDFKKVKELEDAGKTDEARAYTQEFYKKNFWDEAGIENLPDNMKLLAFDTAVNLGVPTAKKMLEQAGDDPQALADLRRQRYSEIVAADPTQAKFSKGWENRVSAISGGMAQYQPAGDMFDRLDPSYLMQVADAADSEFNRDLTNGIRSSMRFASADERTATRQKFSNNQSVQNAMDAMQKELMEDPAGIASQSPAMQDAYSRLSKDDPKTVDEYFNTLAKEQIRMGVPDYQVKYATKAVLDDFKNATEAENATPDMIIEKINAIKDQYGDKYPHVLGEIRQSGVKGPYAIAAEMAGSGYVRDMVEATKLGEEALIAAVPDKSATKDLKADIDSEIADFIAAVNFPSGGVQAGLEYKAAANLLALRHMADGTSRQDAIDRAIKAVMPYQVDGTLVVPNGVSMPAVKLAASDYLARLGDMDIELPPGLEDTPQGEIYSKMLNNAKPVVMGDRVYFYWDSRNPVLDATKVKRDPTTGKVKNPQEAAISFSMSDALTNTDSVTDPALRDRTASTRATLASSIGRDPNDYYKPRASIEGVAHSSPVLYRNAPGDGRRYPYLVTEGSFSRLTPAEQKQAREQIQKNVAYNQKVLSRIPEKERAAFVDYLKKSNELAVEYFYAKAPTGNFDGAGYKRVEQLRQRWLASTGYNYLEVPEWAK